MSERRFKEKLALGIYKKPNPFSTKMSIHCLFDIRKSFDILTDAFLGRARIS
jgi:hypothetical protein